VAQQDNEYRMPASPSFRCELKHLDDDDEFSARRQVLAMTQVPPFHDLAHDMSTGGVPMSFPYRKLSINGFPKAAHMNFSTHMLLERLLGQTAIQMSG